MGADPRIAGIQLTPRFLPMSYVAAEIVSSGSPPPLSLRIGGAAVPEAGPDVVNVTADQARAFRPNVTLLFVEATSPEAIALRERDIELLREAYDEETDFKEKFERGIIVRYVEEDRRNYLLAIIQADGTTLVLSPVFGGGQDVELDKAPFLVGEIHPDMRFWALGLPAPINALQLTDERPKEAQLLDLLVNYPFIDKQESGPGGTRALPVVDPLLILRGTTQRYNEACDKYLLHIGEFDPIGPTKKVGSHAFYRSRVADALGRLPEGALSDSAAQSAVGSAAFFMDEYEGKATNSEEPGHEGLRQFLEQREDAAHGLIRWLESDSLKLIPKLYRKDDGTFEDTNHEDGYVAYFDARLLALSRLSESERGKCYLVQMLDELDTSDPEHPAAFIAEFVLPAKSPSKDTAKIALKSAKGVVGLWIKLVPFILEKVAKHSGDYVVGGETYVRLNAAVQRVTDHITYLFDGPIFNVLDPVRSAVQINVQNKLADLFVDRVELRINQATLSKATGKSLEAAKFLQAHLEALNASIAFASCWEAFRDAKFELKTLGHGLTLLKSINFFGKEAVGRALKKEMFEGKYKAGLTKLSSKLTVAGTVLDLATSSVSALDSYRKGDRDAATADLLSGLAGTAGTAVMLVSGPVGWGLLAISLGLGVYAIVLKDLPFDRLAKFSAFGDPALRGRVMESADQAWTMATSYAEWDPSTTQGLETWLQAAAQLAYGFTVAGLTPAGPSLASEGHFVIEANQLLEVSRLHIEYVATYVDPRDRDVTTTKQGNLWVLHLLTDPGLVDFAGNYDASPGKVRVLDQRRVEITLTQLNPAQIPPQPNVSARGDMELFSLILHVRLDVHGDGDPTTGGEKASLIVPTTKGGKRWVRVNAQNSDDEARSFEKDWLIPQS